MGSGRTERRRRNKQRYISKQQAQIEALQKQLSDKKSFESPATAAVEVCDNPSLKKQRQHIQPTPIPNHSVLVVKATSLRTMTMKMPPSV